MKKEKKYLVLCLLFFLMTNMYAQDTVTLSLDYIINKVETEYPLVLQYDSRVNSLQSKVQGSSSWMPPTVSFGLNSFPYQLDMIKRKDDPMNWAALMFSAEQMIPNTSKLRAKGSYYSSLKEVQQNNAEWTRNILRTQVRILYYQRLVGEKKLKLIEESKKVLNLLINMSESKYTYNQSDLSSIFKAKARAEELTNMETMAISAITESNIGLNALLSRETTTPFKIDTIAVLKNYESTVFLPDTSFNQRSDINSMTNTIRSMEMNKKWMATGNRPDFGVRVSHMKMFGMPNQFTLMGMMTIPIAPWSSKMYKTEVQSMTYDIQAMNLEKESMKLMAIKMTNEKLAMLKYEKQQYDNYNDSIIPSYGKNMEANLLAYKQNTGSFFVLLDAWDMLLMKRFERLNKLQLLFRLQSEYEYENEIR